jgi:hypothetical protein
VADPYVRVRLIILESLFLLVVGGWYMVRHEPLGPPSCSAISISGLLSVQGRNGESRYYNIGAMMPLSKYAVPYDHTFPEGYSGPAALWSAVGKWSGEPHYRLSGRCVDYPEGWKE